MMKPEIFHSDAEKLFKIRKELEINIIIQYINTVAQCIARIALLHFVITIFFNNHLIHVFLFFLLFLLLKSFNQRKD